MPGLIDPIALGFGMLIGFVVVVLLQEYKARIDFDRYLRSLREDRDRLPHYFEADPKKFISLYSKAALDALQSEVGKDRPKT